jgi:hypothetical protein
MDQIDIDKVKAAIQELVQKIFTTVFGDEVPVLAKADRVLFPAGVELIDIEAKLGPTSAPLFDFHLKIAGPIGAAHGVSQPPGNQAAGTDSLPSQVSAR